MGNCKISGQRTLGSLKAGLILLFLGIFIQAEAQERAIDKAFEITFDEILVVEYSGAANRLNFRQDDLPQSRILPESSSPIRIGFADLGSGVLDSFALEDPTDGLSLIEQSSGAMVEIPFLLIDGSNNRLMLPPEYGQLVWKVAIRPVSLASSTPGGVSGERDWGFRFIPSRPVENLLFYPDFVGGELREIQIQGQILSLTHQAINQSIPLLDMGSMINKPPSSWQDPDLSIQRWLDRPEIYHFNFADYRIQTEFFKRLAFFAEKAGFRGRILTEEQMAGMHGWNAHNYRAEDLAHFFTLAQAQEFPLGARELQLKGWLLEWGIILEEPDGGFSPGKGAIVTTSRQMGWNSRRRFFKHEMLHGLYFVDKDFQESVLELWNRADEVFKTIWRRYLRYFRYDSDFDYLAANELLGYLLMYEDSSLLEAFLRMVVNRVTGDYPNLSSVENQRIWMSEGLRIQGEMADLWLLHTGIPHQRMITLEWD